MASDEWPQITCERFDGESTVSYELRARRVREIITGFRMGRVRPEAAEALEQELIALQEPESLWQGHERRIA